MRAVILAHGDDLDALPNEARDVTNILSAAGWTVRLVLGEDATTAGLQRVVGEGAAELVIVSSHSTREGFALTDGALSPAELGRWLCFLEARETILNTCFSREHAGAVRRAARTGIAVTVDPAGVDDQLAWSTVVYIVRAYVRTGDMAQAVLQASGFGSLQYRYIPAGAGTGIDGRVGRMPADEVREQLQVLVRAIEGEAKSGSVGLLTRMNELSVQLQAMATEQRAWRMEVDRKLLLLDQQVRQPVAMSARSAYVTAAAVSVVFVLLLLGLLRLGGGL